MAQWGYIGLVLNYLSKYENPKILEIGIDKGQTTFPMLHHLSMMGKKFSYDAIDVLVREEIKIIAQYFGFNDEQKLKFYEDSSLNVIPKLDSKYNLIFLDGDHNYHTVSRELELISNNLSLNDTIIVVDDYHGRWANKDMFYSTRSEYENVVNATKPMSSEKQGVATAVDDFLSKNPIWSKAVPIKGEPVLLYKENR